LTNAGQLDVGPGSARLQVEGDASFAATATLSLDLGGFSQGLDYDTLHITNHLEAAGRLRLRLRGGFIPSSADVFTLLTFGSGSGSFQNAPHQGRLATEDGAGSFLVELTSQSLRVLDFQSTNAPSYAVPDEWVLRYFDHAPLSGAELFADQDGDGASTYDEYLADTVPTDPNSVFKLIPVRGASPGQWILRFSYSSARSYAIGYSDKLTDWITVDILPSEVSPGLGEWIDDGTQTGGLPPVGATLRRFYRASARPLSSD